jgi:hypothetical protein
MLTTEACAQRSGCRDAGTEGSRLHYSAIEIVIVIAPLALSKNSCREVNLFQGTGPKALISAFRLHVWR